MKTLTELMDNIKILQKGLDDVYGDIAELQEAERSKDNIPDIIDWLKYASQQPLKEHPLTTVDNIEVQGIYLKLLFAVAMCNIYLNHEISPLVYPCQIVAALGENINGERLFKEALTLDSLTIKRYCEQIKSQEIDSYFLIDSLIITGKYEQDNHEKMDYIASLAAIMETTSENFADILNLAKTYVAGSKEFVGCLGEACAKGALFYLKSCTSLKIIETPWSFIAVSENMRDCDEIISQFLPLSSKSFVLFSNISFNNLAENKLSFSCIVKLEFYYCEFKDFDHTVINGEFIEEIVLEQVQFRNCVYENHIGKLYDGDVFFLADRFKERYLTGSSENDIYNCDLGTLIEENEYHRLKNDNNFRISSGLLGKFLKIGKIRMDNVSGKGCYARHFIKYKVYNIFETEKTKVSRGIPDYTENYLFSGISRNQIEENNCAWENCCKLV